MDHRCRGRHSGAERAHVTDPAMTDHGTRATYRAGCDCGPCKAANAEYMRAYRAARVAAGGGRYLKGRWVTLARVKGPRAPLPDHGTIARYRSRYDPCRCGDCRRAWRIYCAPYTAAHRRRRREAR